MKLKKIIFTFFILFTAFRVGLGQEKTRTNDSLLGVSEEVTNCEMSTLFLDQLWNLTKETSNSNGFVIFIARLGTNETRRKINLSRLASIKRVLRNRYSHIPNQKVIVAEGEKVKGHGRIEFYWNGQLVGAILANKNRDLCFSCCP